ncbi:MAG: GspE/PulE family protein [Planctomycetota bacterium]|jgi:general secretion pathway protein E/type IV pilus assembly protein PilB
MQNVLDKLVDAELIEESEARRVQSLRQDGQSLDEALRTGSEVDEERLLQYLSEEFGVPYSSLEDCKPTRELLGKFPAKVLLEHQLMPVREEDGAILIATSRLFDTDGFDELRVACGCELRVLLAPSSEVSRCIKSFLGVGADTLQTLVSDAEDGIEILDEGFDEDIDLSDEAAEASIIKFVNQILAEAIEMRCTDVHFEPFEDQLRVRYRVDGVLVEANIPASVARFRPAIVSRLKILSNLDIAEKRLPQDGRMKLKVSGREIDVRVSVIPMLHGEAVVLRILDRSATLMGLEHLGMGDHERDIFNKTLMMPHGIVLVTGPTGSGKTTTLYAGLNQINDLDRKIITIEDPIEYHLHGVNQIQVSEKTGLTFARGLRSILRHDPDVVLIGEIRDKETAEIAVQASLTGHLVFSTLHTNDAPGALTRLVDMGVEPFLVASSLELVQAQRLVRLICKNCKEELPADDAARLRSELGHDVLPETLYRGRGCRQCQGSGYRGRQGVFEVMPMTERIRESFLGQASSGEIRGIALDSGMKTLRQDGLRLINNGVTTIEEVMRVTKDEQALHKGVDQIDALDAGI